MHYYLITFSEIFYPYLSLMASCERTRIEYKPVPLSTKFEIKGKDIKLLLVKLLGSRGDLREILDIEAEILESSKFSNTYDYTTNLRATLKDVRGERVNLVFECKVLSVAKFEENLVPESLLTHENPSIRDYIKKNRKKF